LARKNDEKVSKVFDISFFQNVTKKGERTVLIPFFEDLLSVYPPLPICRFFRNHIKKTFKNNPKFKLLAFTFWGLSAFTKID
jgi:hypothetical protein